MTVWKCVSCGEELPGNRRSDKHFCGVRCRVRAHRIRKGEGKHVRPARKHGHTALKVALGTAAAATAAAVAVELVRKSQDVRLAENERKLAEVEAQLRKSRTEKEELQRAAEVLRNRVEQVTREKKGVESQLCQSRVELAKEKQLVKTLRSSLESTHLDMMVTEQRLQVESRGQAALANWAFQREEEYRRQRSESDQRIHALLENNDELTRQLTEATDSQEAQLAAWSASQRHL